MVLNPNRLLECPRQKTIEALDTVSVETQNPICGLHAPSVLSKRLDCFLSLLFFWVSGPQW